MFFIGGVSIFQLSDWGAIDKRIQHSKEIKENFEIYDRTLSSKAMGYGPRSLLFGWGAGSFRYISQFIKGTTRQFGITGNQKARLARRRVYHYAHNDWLQFLAEYGIIGCAFLGGMFVSLLISVIRLCAYAKLAGYLM